jgi:DNA repair protein RadC
MLIRRFSTIENTLTASVETLEDFVNGNVALYIKLAAYVTSRRRMDKFVFNRRHTMVEIADYFKALYIGIPIENVYMMCFDLKGRATVCEKISEGIVNSADVLPRRLLEIALRSSAAKVVIVHNHPFGRTVPSPEDIDLTVRVIELFRTVGIELSHHLIVSGQNCDSIRFGEPT